MRHASWWFSAAPKDACQKLSGTVYFHLLTSMFHLPCWLKGKQFHYWECVFFSQGAKTSKWKYSETPRNDKHPRLSRSLISPSFYRHIAHVTQKVEKLCFLSGKLTKNGGQRKPKSGKGHVMAKRDSSFRNGYGTGAIK